MSKTNREVLQKGIMHHMERQNLWKLGEDQAKFLSKRGSRKRKKSQVKKKVPCKKSKLSHEKKTSSVEDSVAQKQKSQLSNKKLSAKKKKSKKDKKQEKLPERYLLPDELEFHHFLLESKGYYINPMERDGNCLFRAVADQIYNDPNLYPTIRNWCANFMQEEKNFYQGFIDDDMNFSAYISQLRQDGSWGGNFEIMAISEIYKCRVEVYEFSEEPRVVNNWDFQGSNNPPIRIFYRNNHYASVRSEGDRNLIFQALQPGQLEQKMLTQSKLLKSDEFHDCNKSGKDLNLLDPDMKYAIQLSKAIEESRKSFLRYYATLVVKPKSSQ